MAPLQEVARATAAAPAKQPTPAKQPEIRRWRVQRTAAFDRWLGGLDADSRAHVRAGMRAIEKRGPVLGRPFVDSIQGSRLHNLKELRLREGVRVLFAFDPNRTAVMLTGGNKTGRWDRWYPRQIGLAEREFGRHLQGIGREKSRTRDAHQTRGRGGPTR